MDPNIIRDKRAGPPAASESAFRNSSSQKSMKAHNTMFVVNPYKYVYFLGWIPTNWKLTLPNLLKTATKMMPKLTENCCQIDAQNALKSSLGGTLGLNFSSFGTGSRRMETEIRYPVVDPSVSSETARGNRSRGRTQKAATGNPEEGVVQIY